MHVSDVYICPDWLLVESCFQQQSIAKPDFFFFFFFSSSSYYGNIRQTFEFLAISKKEKTNFQGEFTNHLMAMIRFHVDVILFFFAARLPQGRDCGAAADVKKARCAMIGTGMYFGPCARLTHAAAQ